MTNPAAWSFDYAPPDGWKDLLVSHNGGFFHSPAALSSSFPEGEPLFARLIEEGGTRGIALGVAQHCRLAPSKSHVYFAALPALADAPGGGGRSGRGTESGRRFKARMREVLPALVEALGRQRAVEIVMDSFGNNGVVPRVRKARPGSMRWEHVVILDRDPAEILASFGTTHRRHVRRGQRRDWELRRLGFDQGNKVLHTVLERAAERAAARGEAFSAGWLRPAARKDIAPFSRPWGQATVAAYDSNALLAAIHLGWANRQAYYLRGGSTAPGYRTGAATWLHWSVMTFLSDRGFRKYNLGGTPAAGSDPTAPSHGLQRFKEHFGGLRVRCRGAHWDLSPGHLAAHRVASFLRRRG